MKGNDIKVVKITAREPASSVKPRVAVVAGIHGNEAVSSEIALALTKYLVRSNGIDSTIAEVCN